MSSKLIKSKLAYPKYSNFQQENRTMLQAEVIYNQRINDSIDVFNKFSLDFFDRICPVCGGSKKRNLPSFHDTYQVVECCQCLTQFVSPCPSAEALAYYYNECSCNALLGKLLRSRHLKSNPIISERTNFIIDLLKNNFSGRKLIRILEIGCNSGIFLSELKNAVSMQLPDWKFDFYGIDIDQSAIKKNVDLAISLEAISVEDYAKEHSEKFDVILHFELIEHLADPFSFMRSVRRLMARNGIHHFHTPNANGFDNIAIGYNEFRPLAHGIFPPMHLQAFTPMNMTHFALRSGFKLIQLDTPGSLDVDIVRSFLDKDKTIFQHIRFIPKDYLAVFQQWLRVLGGSSHMRVTLMK